MASGPRLTLARSWPGAHREHVGSVLKHGQRVLHGSEAGVVLGNLYLGRETVGDGMCLTLLP